MEDTLIQNPKSLLYRVLLRFARGFMAGAVSSMLLVGVFAGNSWAELNTWLIALALSGVSGGITGGIMAIDKLIRK